MKKLISLLLAVLFCVLPVFTAFAAEKEPAHGDYYISEADFEKLDYVSAEYGAETRASGLITQKALKLAPNGNDIVIQGYTKGSLDVKKCGFTYITLQRYENGVWKDYVKFEDLYDESNYCYVTKYVTAARGYNYRVTAKHYAKKSLLSTEKIEVTTASIWF